MALTQRVAQSHMFIRLALVVNCVLLSRDSFAALLEIKGVKLEDFIDEH
jgi:hypothetical protein